MNIKKIKNFFCLIFFISVNIYANKSCLESEFFKSLQSGTNDNLTKNELHSAICCDTAYNFYSNSPSLPSQEEQDWVYNDCISLISQDLSDESYGDLMNKKHLEYMEYFTGEKRPQILTSEELNEIENLSDYINQNDLVSDKEQKQNVPEIENESEDNQQVQKYKEFEKYKEVSDWEIVNPEGEIEEQSEQASIVYPE